jgi:hypothetical protein
MTEEYLFVFDVVKIKRGMLQLFPNNLLLRMSISD